MGVFFTEDNEDLSNDFYLETLLSFNFGSVNFGMLQSNQPNEIFKSNIEFLCCNINIDIDNSIYLENVLNRLKYKIRSLNLIINTSYSFENNEKNKILHEALISLSEVLNNRKMSIINSVGLPSSEIDLDKSTLDLLKEIGFYDYLIEKYDAQNRLNIVALLGREESFLLEVLNVQTKYFAFCSYIGLIKYLEEYYSKINNRQIEINIGQFLTKISNFDSKNTYSNFRRYYLNRDNPSSRHFALNINNITQVSGLIK